MSAVVVMVDAVGVVVIVVGVVVVVVLVVAAVVVVGAVPHTVSPLKVAKIIVGAFSSTAYWV